MTEYDDYPEPACLIHDISGHECWEVEWAECTCPPAETATVWQPIEPGDIKPGMRAVRGEPRP